MDKKIIGIICVVAIVIVGLILALSGGGGGDNSSSKDTTDPFNGTGAKLENVTISSSYSFLKVNGKIMFKNDESYASISADVNLKDGSKISESLVKNWNNVNKDQWYTFDGSLLSTSAGKHSKSEIESIDFKYKNKVIYTWKNS